MSDEIKKEREVKKEVKKDAAPDLTKQVANVAFTVRKMKNWLEEKLGADLDGDGRVGSGPYNKVKKLGVLLAIVGLATVVSAAPANTNIAVWYPSRGAPQTYIDQNGGIFAPSMTVNDFTVNTNVTISGNATVTGAITGGTLKVTGSAVVGDGLNVRTNAIIGANLVVTGNVVVSGIVSGDCSGASSVPVSLTPETGAVTAEGANNLITPTATPSLETVTITNYYNPVLETTIAYYTNGLTVTNAAGDNVLMVTNVTWSTEVVIAITNVTVAITPNLASNAVVAVTVTGGDAVWTNAAASNP